MKDDLFSRYANLYSNDEISKLVGTSEVTPKAPVEPHPGQTNEFGHADKFAFDNLAGGVDGKEHIQMYADLFNNTLGDPFTKK